MTHGHTARLSVVGPSDEHRDGLGRLAAIGLMTPGIVHDINNLLQTVGSVLRVIDQRSANSAPLELAALAADGLNAIDRAATIAKRLMAFGRPGPSVSARVGVNQLVRTLEPLLRWAVGPEVGYRFSLDEDALEIHCDPRDLENALINLAINARDAMPNGGLLALHTYKALLPLDLPGLPRGDYAIIAVTDTGIGMSSEVATRAFDPFFTTKAAVGGFGMGLASVKAFANAAGGGADIISRPAKGTTVRLYLPLAGEPSGGV
jgi:signal transduction histidine kinase